MKTRIVYYSEFQDIRGNLNTRFRKLDAEDGPYSAIILAAAGVKRLGWEDRISSYIPSDICLHAVGQGALGIECRKEDWYILKVSQTCFPFTQKFIQILICYNTSGNIIVLLTIISLFHLACAEFDSCPNSHQLCSGTRGYAKGNINRPLSLNIDIKKYKPFYVILLYYATLIWNRHSLLVAYSWKEVALLQLQLTRRSHMEIVMKRPNGMMERELIVI